MVLTDILFAAFLNLFVFHLQVDLSAHCIVSSVLMNSVIHKFLYQGHSDVGYIGIYTPPQISNRFVHVWDINTCFEIVMTS